MSNALQQLSEQLARDGERCVRESRLLDYAWLKDQHELLLGKEPHFLDDLIDRQFAELLTSGDEPSGLSDTGTNS